MYKTILTVWIGVLLFLPAAAQAETISISTGDWPPFLEEKAKHHGYANHMVRLSFATQGVDCKFIFLPWKRAYESTKNGKYHGTNYWYCTPRRQKDFLCADPVLEDNYMLFHLKRRRIEWETLDDLKPFTFGLTLGYTYTDEFVARIKKGDLQGEWTPTDVQNFTKLLRGRVDIVPIAEAVGLYILNRNFPPEQREQVTYNPRSLVVQTAHPLFPKSRPDAKKYRDLFNKGLKILRDDGTLDLYYEKMIMGWYSQ